MLLLVDAGNSRIKWAVVDCAERDAKSLGNWSASGSVERAKVLHLADAWRGLPIARVLLSNVAGQEMRESLDQSLLRGLGLKPVPMEWFASVPLLGGVRNAYRDPAQLGCDRFAAAIGAHALFPARHLIVATCGTATTIDAVTAEGVFLGGMILPGLGLMAASLASNTAQLPQVARQGAAPAPFADNTGDAIVTGCIAAQVGAIERAVAAQARLHQHAEVRCILSGGAAAMLAPHLTISCDTVDNLVLIGLQAVAIQCAPI